MSEPLYDFRDGMLLEKVVYKDDSCNCGYVLLYLACLLLTWIWGSAWFALFFYSYVFHEKVALIVFVVVWCLFAVVVIVIGYLTIQRSKNEKRYKKEQKEERERQEKEINDAKRRRNEKRKEMNYDNYNDNMDEINTNIEPNVNHNHNQIDYNSERRPALEENGKDLIGDDNK